MSRRKRQGRGDFSCLDGKCEFESVVGEVDIGWKLGFGFVNIKFVGKVGEVGRSSSERFCRGLRFGEVHVCGVFSPMKAVDNEDWDIHEDRLAFFWDRFDIGDVGKRWHTRIIKAIPLRFLVSMNNWDGSDL